MKFLDFVDIDDFTALSHLDFEEKNFFDSHFLSENVNQNASYCFEEELKQEESIHSLLKGLSEKSAQKQSNDYTQDGTVFQCKKFTPDSDKKLEPIETKTDFEEEKNSQTCNAQEISECGGDQDLSYSSPCKFQTEAFFNFEEFDCKSETAQVKNKRLMKEASKLGKAMESLKTNLNKF